MIVAVAIVVIVVVGIVIAVLDVLEVFCSHHHAYTHLCSHLLHFRASSHILLLPPYIYRYSLLCFHSHTYSCVPTFIFTLAFPHSYSLLYLDYYYHPTSLLTWLIIFISLYSFCSYHPIARKMIANDLAAADAVDAAEAGNGTSGAAAAASVAAVAAEVTSAHVATTTAAEVVAATASSGGSPVVQARAVPMAVPVSSTRSAANVAAAAPAAAEHAPATAESSSTSPSTSLFGVAVAGAAIAAITAIALLRSRK